MTQHFMVARHPDDEALIKRLVLPHAQMTAVGVATDPMSSYVGGYPFVPVGTPVDEVWPVDVDGDAMVFLCQVNFGQVPPLAGYPSKGLLQWFVEDDPAYGLTFDENCGKDGFVARWWTPEDLAKGSLRSPGAPTPVVEFSPLKVPGPVAVEFTAGVDLPCINEVCESGDPDMATFAGWVLSDTYDLGFPDEHECFGGGDKVGGYGYYEQSPPDALRDGDCLQVLIQLDSTNETFTLWGDLGSGQLLGFPADLARGDLSSLRWGWACG